MKYPNRLIPVSLALALAAGGAGCVVAAAGAGAAAAVHLSDRGAETLISADVPKTEAAARKAFTDLGISETKTRSESSGDSEKRILDGTSPDREITVTISKDGDRSKVEVVARKSAVTWDKDYAREIIQKIISNAG